MRGTNAGGFTLIEVLVAVLLLAIGIAGAAGAQLSAMRTRHGTGLMTTAVQLAGSLADRMRANPAQLLAGDASVYAQLRYDAARDGPPPPASVHCYAGGDCGSAQMAQFDMAEVQAALHSQFPGGRIVVCHDAAIWDEGRAALSWDCTAGAGAPLVIKLGWRGKRADGADDVEAAGGFAPSVAVAVEAAQ